LGGVGLNPPRAVNSTRYARKLLPAEGPIEPLPLGMLLELSEKYIEKRKLRANFIETGISTLQGAKGNLAVISKQI
jgi:hypothetical protein